MIRVLQPLDHGIATRLLRFWLQNIKVTLLLGRRIQLLGDFYCPPLLPTFGQFTLSTELYRWLDIEYALRNLLYLGLRKLYLVHILLEVWLVLRLQNRWFVHSEATFQHYARNWLLLYNKLKNQVIIILASHQLCCFFLTFSAKPWTFHWIICLDGIRAVMITLSLNLTLILYKLA